MATNTETIRNAILKILRIATIEITPMFNDINWRKEFDYEEQTQNLNLKNEL